MRKVLTEHPLMKLIALSLSVALWWFVRSERQNEKTVDVPVSYANAPAELIFSGPLQETIRLRLRGPQSKLAKVEEDYFPNHVIDLKNSKSGQNSFWLYEEDFRLPFGVYVTQIFPQAIRVQLKPRVQRKISIRPRYVGELPPGIEIAEVSVTPKTVMFESFEDELDKIKFFYTEPINLSGRMKDFEGDYFIDTASFRGELENDKVSMAFQLVEKEISESIPSVPIAFDGDLSHIVLEPETIEVTVAGPLSKVLKLVKTPPVPTLDMQVLKRAMKERRNQEVPVVIEEVKDITFTLNPDKVRLRFK
ncbi:MAG: hypothetical protein KDK51_08120 [Deltaproteobacteria bacterium]|nr:hypothetical protein [Deltaproteobacteria bacterium]